MPVNTVRDEIKIYVEEIKRIVDDAEKSDTSHGLLITAAMDDKRLIDRKDQPEIIGQEGEKNWVRSMDAKIWGQPENIEELLLLLAMSNKTFGMVVLKVATRMAENVTSKVIKTEGGIILPGE